MTKEYLRLERCKQALTEQKRWVMYPRGTNVTTGNIPPAPWPQYEVHEVLNGVESVEVSFTGPLPACEVWVMGNILDAVDHHD